MRCFLAVIVPRRGAKKLEKVVAADQHDGAGLFPAGEGAGTGRKMLRAATAADNQAPNLPANKLREVADGWQNRSRFRNVSLRSRDVLNQVDLSDLGRRQAVDKREG